VKNVKKTVIDNHWNGPKHAKNSCGNIWERSSSTGD